MHSPRVSVLLPIWQPKPEHLRAAIDSLRAQTEPHWHAVIRDDASDPSPEPLVAPLQGDVRFSFIRNAKRLGIGGNWNACVERAVAPNIAFLFQDDLWDAGYLAEALRVLDEHPSVGFVSMEHAYAYEGGRNPSSYYEELSAFKRSTIEGGIHRGPEFLRWWISQDLRPGLIGEPSFVVLRRSLLESVGPFREDMPQSLDNEMWIRCLLKTDWYYVQKPFGTFRVHAAGASAINDAIGAGLTDRFRIFVSLRGLPEPELRRSVDAAMQRTFGTLVRKFFARRKAGKTSRIAAGDKKVFIAFFLRHPLTVLRALGSLRAS